METSMKRVLILLALAFATSYPLASGATTHTTAEAHAAQQGAVTEGEVRRIDKDAKKLTIRHGSIANLEMPPMTMVFQVTETSVLDQIKVGDKIRFKAEKIGGAYTVTALEAAK
jgi:Cu/Ag efflux protein CusF